MLAVISILGWVARSENRTSMIAKMESLASRKLANASRRRHHRWMRSEKSPSLLDV
jgi:hypothetical protein